MGYEGSLADSPFSEVLQHIARSSETGILTLQGQDEIIGVTFLDGEVVSVDAVNQAPEDGLGQVLEASGLVSRDAFSSLVAEHQAGGGRVLDLLVERGYVDRQQLLAAMREQTLRLCAEVSSWKAGQFRFYRGDQVSYEHGIEPIQVDDLLAKLTDGKPKKAPKVVETDPFAIEMPSMEPVATPQYDIVRLEDMEDEPDLDLGLEPRPQPGPAIEPEPELPPIEMPDVEYWSEVHGDALDPPRRERRSWKTQFNWGAIHTPVMPGRLLGIAMLVGLAGVLVLAPARFLVPLDGQERIRGGFTSGVQTSLYAKVDQAAKTFYLVRGEFPGDLEELVRLNLLAEEDTQLPDDRRLSYTEAPVSYLLAIEGEARVESAVRTETISGNFLLDPDFSPPELIDSPPLVLLD